MNTFNNSTAQNIPSSHSSGGKPLNDSKGAEQPQPSQGYQYINKQVNNVKLVNNHNLTLNVRNFNNRINSNNINNIIEDSNLL